MTYKPTARTLAEHDCLRWYDVAVCRQLLYVLVGGKQKKSRPRCKQALLQQQLLLLLVATQRRCNKFVKIMGEIPPSVGRDAGIRAHGAIPYAHIYGG